MPFLGPLDVRDLDGSHWQLLTDLQYFDGKDTIWTIPAGFVTDLASIPQIFWSLLPHTGEYDRAAVLHDWLYVTQPPDIQRADADHLLLEAMESLGVGWATRRTIYLGVRAGGGVSWQRGLEHKGRGLARVFMLGGPKLPLRPWTKAPLGSG